MKEITYAQAINEAISEEMRRDENVFMMGEDIWRSSAQVYWVRSFPGG